ncbi:hypothetical protein IU479_22325 [Nocardia abscessus]|uniref:hypothetical protein n=1 Tax=Nocardia abscessus TaxID=120957 RepID=UPI001895C3AC|nr:hypothetical protein [Nocardia abscessus]MBF6220841.1 hypothetical protein [Nocardia abscessus]
MMVASVVAGCAVLWVMANFFVAMAVLERAGCESVCRARPAVTAAEVAGTVTWMQARTLPTTCPLVVERRVSA